MACSAEFVRRPDRDETALDDDREPVGQMLSVVHPASREQHRLARARSPSTSSQARWRALGSKPVVGSSRTAVRIADEAEGEVEPPALAPGKRLDLSVTLVGEADELEDIVDGAAAADTSACTG